MDSMTDNALMKKRQARKKQEEADDRTLLTIAQVMDALSVSRPTIYKLVKEGKLELVKIGTYHSRITNRSLNTFLDDVIGK